MHVRSSQPASGLHHRVARVVRPDGPGKPARTERCCAIVLVSLLACVAPQASASDRNERARTLTVEARDLTTNAPVPGLALRFSAAGDIKHEATTGADGTARFNYALPEKPGSGFFNVQASGEGLVPLFARWIGTPAAPEPPERLRFQTEKATTIRGRALDEEDRPVPDAVVVITAQKRYPRSEQMVDVGYESIKTDDQGRWSFTGVPEKPDAVELAAYHYLCLTDRPSFFPEPFEPLAALRDGSAVLRLRHGTRIEGTVLAPDGQPVANAEVTYGGYRGYANAIPSIKTDAKGHFTFGIKPGTVATLGARAAGRAPAVQEVKVGNTAQRVYLTLEPAHSVHGRVVDATGKPVAGAQVQLLWSGPDRTPRHLSDAAVTRELRTDADGQFDWKDAPGRGVRGHFSAAGLTSRQNMPLASDADHVIVLTPTTTIKGAVVDRATGEPIRVFSLAQAAAWEAGNPLIWQTGSHFDERVPKSAGAFEYTTSSPAHRYLIRVQAEGYLPEDSEFFTTDGATHAFTFRLARAEPIRGTVRNPDGTPAREGFVYLVPPHRDGWIDYLELSNDDVPERNRERTVHARLDTDGRFALPPQKENFALLVLAGAGFAQVPRQALRGEDVLQLQPWARVAGSLTIDGKPAADVALQSYDPEDRLPADGEPRLVRRFFVKTDARGRFALPRVLPGRLSLVQWVPNGVNRRIWPVVRATLDAESGRSYDLNIGTSGRVVTGRLTLPDADTWMIRKAEVVPTGTKSGRPIGLGVEFLESGRIRVLDVPPGDHTLEIALHEPPPKESCGWGRLLGRYTRRFSVPEPARADDVPIDLGLLEPVETGTAPLQAGDVAPDFRIKTLEGKKEIALADYRGKYVLLDFWATWCAPCLAELPNLQAIQEQFGTDARFVLLSVSVDERASDASSTVKARKLSWVQAFAGPDSPAVTAYGAAAIPATYLIGPDGKILARDLRGEALKSAVAKALKADNPSSDR